MPQNIRLGKVIIDYPNYDASEVEIGDCLAESLEDKIHYCVCSIFDRYWDKQNYEFKQSYPEEAIMKTMRNMLNSFEFNILKTVLKSILPEFELKVVPPKEVQGDNILKSSSAVYSLYDRNEENSESRLNNSQSCYNTWEDYNLMNGDFNEELKQFLFGKLSCVYLSHN